MTTLIEKLNKLPTYDVDDEGEILRDKGGFYIHSDDLCAIIEEHKRESGEAVGAVFDVSKHGLSYAAFTKTLPIGTMLYTSPQPSHTQLIGELLAALESNRRCLVNPSMREEYDCAFGEIMKKAREAVK